MPVYRLLISLFAAWVLTGCLLRRDWVILRARLGRIAPVTGAPRLWLHGASNGELTSARPLIDALLDARPDLHLLVTANNPTAVEMVRGWGLPRVEAYPAPLDLAAATRRLIARWQIVGHVTLESEIWPNRLVRLGALGLPVFVVGGRLSERTSRVWHRLRGAARPALAAITWVAPQDAGSAARYADLGLDPDSIGAVATLKALYRPDPGLVPDPVLAATFPRGDTWLAASTHAPEEDVVIDAHLKALRARPDLRLILAPRHPRRADDIADRLATAGLRYSRRSAGETADAPVLLADTLGEMPIWYQLAGTVFVGGSIAPRGGHTPYEPAHFGCALIHGPDTHNFAAAYDALQNADAAICVRDAGEMAAALAALSDPARRAALADAAAHALPGSDGPAPILQRILQALPSP